MRASAPVLLAAAALAVPAGASAATLNGTVVGEPAARGTTVSVPVLLGEGSRHAARLARPLVRVHAPALRGIRTRTGAIAAPQLRVGDRVSFASGGRSGVLRVRARGTAPTFATLAAGRTSARAAATKALAAAQAVGSGSAAGAQSAPELRDALSALRTSLNLLSAQLRTAASGFGAALDQIAAARPVDATRAAAVARLQAPFLAGLVADRADATHAADAIDAAVTTLDEQIDDVGGVSAPPVPIEGVSAVTSTINGVLDLLRE